MILYAVVYRPGDPRERREVALVAEAEVAEEIMEYELDWRYAAMKAKAPPEHLAGWVATWDRDLGRDAIMRIETRPLYDTLQEYRDAHEASNTPVKGVPSAPLEGFSPRPRN